MPWSEVSVGSARTRRRRVSSPDPTAPWAAARPRPAGAHRGRDDAHRGGVRRRTGGVARPGGRRDLRFRQLRVPAPRPRPSRAAWAAEIEGLRRRRRRRKMLEARQSFRHGFRRRGRNGGGLSGAGLALPLGQRLAGSHGGCGFGGQRRSRQDQRAALRAPDAGRPGPLPNHQCLEGQRANRSPRAPRSHPGSQAGARPRHGPAWRQPMGQRRSRALMRSAAVAEGRASSYGFGANSGSVRIN